MVPTFTCGFFRSKTPFAMTKTSRSENFKSRRKFHSAKQLALGIEPRTSSLPRTRSTPELCQHRSNNFIARLDAARLDAAPTSLLGSACAYRDRRGGKYKSRPDIVNSRGRPAMNCSKNCPADLQFIIGANCACG